MDTPPRPVSKLTEEQLPAFARRFEERCRLALASEPLERVLIIDAEIPLGVLSLEVVEEIEKLEPHGIGNPRPLLLATDVQVEGQPRPVGDQKKHLQLRLRQGDVVLKAIAWGMAEKGQVLTSGSRCSVVFTPSINEWQNRRDVQLEIKDFELVQRCSMRRPEGRTQDPTPIRISARMSAGTSFERNRPHPRTPPRRPAMRTQHACAPPVWETPSFGYPRGYLRGRLSGRDHSAAEQDDIRVDRVHEADGPDGQVMGGLAHQTTRQRVAGLRGLGDRPAGQVSE